MTLGTSLIWIAILFLLAFGIRYVTHKKKWCLVLKIIGGLACLGILVSLAIHGWYVYKERPQPIDTLGAISLGMTPLEVTLALGKPSGTNENDMFDSHRRYVYTDYSGTPEYIIKFSEVTNSIEYVESVCSRDYSKTIFGLGKYSSEFEVIKKLGAPVSQSIHKDGLKKMISYPEWKVSFEIEKNDVISTCVSEDGDIKYLEEYGV